MVTPASDFEKSHSEKSHSAGSLPLHPVELSAEELLKQCNVQKTRRSGPGGQHRNKVETAVVLTHVPTGLQVEASERRSQSENLSVGLERLRMRLAVHCRISPGEDPTPSPLWKQRCRNSHIVVSSAHADFPRLLAEALNHIAATHWEIRPAAERLGCSSSQLLKLLKDAPQAWTLLQEERRKRGLKDLH